MKAVALTRYLPIDHPESLLDVDLPKPMPAGRDLLVRVHAVSVNPVDCKVRSPKDKVESMPRILGWDAAGVVEAVGKDVTLFRTGDQVFYAGDITRAGSNAEYQLVDERIAGPMPKSLDFTAAAALPLTAITAWEALFDRLAVRAEDAGKTLLVIGGAGGVGSIAIQLAKQVAALKVIATASRPASQSWVLALGADHTINHAQDITAQLHALGYPQVDYILCLNDIDAHFPAMAKAIAPQGRICSIVENKNPLNLGLLKDKSASFCWEFMFTRSMYQTTDMVEQHRLLRTVAQLVDEGRLRSTLADSVHPLNAANLKKAHSKLEAGHMIGKLVLAVDS